jgi:hypothetical protein
MGKKMRWRFCLFTWGFKSSVPIGIACHRWKADPCRGSCISINGKCIGGACSTLPCTNLRIRQGFVNAWNDWIIPPYFNADLNAVLRTHLFETRLLSRAKRRQTETNMRDRCYDFFYIFAKNLANKWRFWLKTKLGTLCKTLIITLVFWEKRQFFRRNLSKIAENCGHNTDPWSRGQYRVKVEFLLATLKLGA